MIIIIDNLCNLNINLDNSIKILSEKKLKLKVILK